MKNKKRIFKKAMSLVKSEAYSCNCLGFAIDRNYSDNPERIATVDKYRYIYGFNGENWFNDFGNDAFLMAVEDGKEKNVFGLRILLLSFAEQVWNDV